MMKRDKKMTTKIKLTVAEVMLVIVLALSIMTAVQLNTGTVAAGGSHLPDVAGETCSSSCTNG
jgi:hypothetical protein